MRKVQHIFNKALNRVYISYQIIMRILQHQIPDTTEALQGQVMLTKMIQ
jgi:hypothetical protein